MRRSACGAALALVLVLATQFDAPRAVAAEADPEALEQQLFELVNRDRAAAGLKPLQYDADLAAVARAHSLDMADHNYFSHTSPTTGDSSDRIFKAGISARATAENIAKDFSVASAHKSLMDSPPHHRNLMSPEFNRFGAGIVIRGGYHYVTENFCLGLPRTDPVNAALRVIDRVNSRRRSSDLAPLTPARELMDIAQQVAEAQCQRQKLLGKLPGELAARRGLGYQQFWTYTFLDASTNLASKMREVANPELNRIGVGVSVNRTQEHGLGMLWVVVLLARM